MKKTNKKQINALDDVGNGIMERLASMDDVEEKPKDRNKEKDNYDQYDFYRNLPVNRAKIYENSDKYKYNFSLSAIAAQKIAALQSLEGLKVKDQSVLIDLAIDILYDIRFSTRSKFTGSLINQDFKTLLAFFKNME